MLSFQVTCNRHTFLFTTFSPTFSPTLLETSHHGTIHDTKRIAILPQSNVIFHALLSRQ